MPWFVSLIRSGNKLLVRHHSFITFKCIRTVCSSCGTLPNQVTRNPRFYYMWEHCAQLLFLMLIVPNTASFDLRADLLCLMGAFRSGLHPEFVKSAKLSLAECALLPSKHTAPLLFCSFAFMLQHPLASADFPAFPGPSVVNLDSLPWFPSLSCASWATAMVDPIISRSLCI